MNTKALVLTLAASGALGHPAGGQAASRCAASGTTTVLQNAKVRVYHQPASQSNADRIYYACLKASGRRSKIGGDTVRQTLGLFRLTGEMVGFRRAIDEGNDLVGFVNARSSRRPTVYETEGEVRTVAINRFGYLAWTVDNQVDPSYISNTLWAITEFRGRVMFDYGRYAPGEGRPIAGVRFRSGGGVLEWKNRGSARSRDTVGQ